MLFFAIGWHVRVVDQSVCSRLSGEGVQDRHRALCLTLPVCVDIGSKHMLCTNNGEPRQHLQTCIASSRISVHLQVALGSICKA